MAPATLQSSTTGISTNSDSSKIDLADQKEIEAIWKEVHAKVIELAGGDPKKVQQSLTIEDVLGYIDRSQKADAEKAEEYGEFKNIVGQTLQCISTIGGIVTDGMSNVFAPAGMCYNALTFVIQAWQGYEGTFANLAELLEKCVEFFERLQSYQGRMDGRLTRLASQNLRLFVEICSRTIKLRKKHSRFLRFTQQLFLNDDGVQDLLAMIDRLNSKEALLVNAQTFRIVSDSAGDVKLILETQKELKREDEAKRWRRSIAKALGFPGTALDNDGEPVPTWQRAFDTRLNSLVEGTGAWWKTDDTFSHWATAQYPEESIFVLSGTGGTGKTSMMANTIKSIRRLGSKAPSSRVVAVYYFADGDKRKADDEDDSKSLQRVSRTLLWQLATSYEAMTKSVASVVERATDFDGALDLWDQLFFNNKEIQNSNTTFYIFIDSFDPDLVPLLQKHYKLADKAKVRVFLTGRPDLVTGYLDQADGVTFAEVPVTRRNSQDVEKYIISQMDTMPMLRDTSRQGISEWRQVIMDELRDKCAGDYFKLNTSLAALAKVDLIEDIREVLRDAGKPRIDQIKAELRRLNNTRTLKEIREINEIILWIETGRRYFSIEAMEAILSVKHQRPSVMGQSNQPPPLTRRQTSNTLIKSGNTEESASLATISLLPLAQKIREKYPIFSVTDSGVVDWRNPEIMSHIPIREGQQDIAVDGQSSSQSQVIQESEINIVRYFLGNVCSEELFKRFEFEAFFNEKLGARLKEYIHLDPDNADIRIAITCLSILTDGELRRQETLRQYAMFWFMEHLQAVDLSAADRKLKGQMGPLLVRLFTEDCGIDSLFWAFDANVSMKTWEQGEAEYLREARNEWLYSTSGVHEVERWFNDSSVTKLITDEPGLSFLAAVKAPTKSLHHAVLSHAARRLATHLFIEMDFLKRHFLSAACFLRGYLARLEGKEMPDDPDVYRDDKGEAFATWEVTKFSLGELEKIETWAYKELADSKSTPALESLWEIHGALQAFQLCDNEEEKMDVSQRRAKRALELNPQNWHACHFVAGRPATGKEEGVELLKRAKNAVDNIRAKDETWMDNSANTSLIARITFDLGNKLWELGDFRSAARTHRESLEYDYVHFSAYAKVLSRYEEHQKWDEVIAFIETLNRKSSIWDAYFDELVNEFIIGLLDEDSDMLAYVADTTSRWDVIEEFFAIATEIGSKHKVYDLLFLLRETFARTLELTSGTVDEKTVISTRVAALESIQAHPSDTLPQGRIYAMKDLLAQIYLGDAFQPNTSEEKIESLGLSLSALLPDVSDGMDAWGNITTICCIIRYHYKRKTRSGPAKRWIERIVRAGIELLSDSDTDNDTYAFWLLGRLFVTIEDNENHQITWNMRNAAQAQDLAKWDDWVSTPIASPTKIKSAQLESMASRLDRKIPRTNSIPSLSTKDRKGSASGDSNGKENGDAGDNNGKPARTATASSAPELAHEDKEFQPKVLPTRIATDIVEAVLDDAPPKPTWFVGCDGCDGQWTVMDEPLLNCADCVGNIQLDRQCHALLMKDELKLPGFKFASSYYAAVYYYSILGVDRWASDHELRTAYYRLARTHHPDKNIGNEEAATAKFQEVKEAFETLRDPEKRWAYNWSHRPATFREQHGANIPRSTQGNATLRTSGNMNNIYGKENLYTQYDNTSGENHHAWYGNHAEENLYRGYNNYSGEDYTNLSAEVEEAMWREMHRQEEVGRGAWSRTGSAEWVDKRAERLPNFTPIPHYRQFDHIPAPRPPPSTTHPQSRSAHHRFNYNRGERRRPIYNPNNTSWYGDRRRPPTRS
ncbi:hypothetical protein E0Z10_g3730 [Xylaria hypoxylon]|uniref:J domain-containing protein n=1 Tax=Xylaria hypoxylon TaxID=37992 RepID=A0A4Z0YMA1_9PEZI|nr:hypothetical protein E0Z10_g3730 [Xylaria hypoxylon]